VRVRSVLTCDAKVGICQTCYGLSLATGRGRGRRGGRDHGRPVDRRARYAADDAYLPHRWCGRRRHHPGSAPRGRAVRGSHPEGQGRPRRGRRSGADRRRRGRPPGRHRDEGRRRRVQDLSSCPPARRDRRRGRARAQLTVGPLDPKEVLEIRGVRACSSTWSIRSRRSTAPRVWRSTTSTSS
jgi:DNA-directed RNA polymerase subunit beta'